MLLAGDIGGTKTVLALYSAEAGSHAPLREQTFASGRYASLEAIITEFLGQGEEAVTGSVFAVAGPVVGGRATITNLPWVIDEQLLREAFAFQAANLLNDLEAIACAVPHLHSEEVEVLNEGRAMPGGTIAVIAPGTGLGEAFLTWDGARYHPHASEGGHADFAPTNELELALLDYLHDRYDHVSYERICSGMGLPNIYDFLRDTGRAKEPEWLAAALAEAEDRTPVIVNNALDEDKACGICTLTLQTFVSVLGAESGNLALKVLATGGVYIGGGIPPRILPALKHKRFLKAFLRKGRLSHVLAPIPVHVILNARAALLGAASYGLNL